MKEINDRMKRIDEMKRQRAQLAEERRKIEDDIRYKQAQMMSKFEIIQHKDKNLSRDDYYKEIFGIEGNNNTSKSNNRSKMSSTMKYEEKEEVDTTEVKKDPVTDTNNREEEKYETEEFNKEEPKAETNEDNERRFNVEP